MLQLRGVDFEWNKDKFPERSFNEGVQIGFVAQEVESVLPELVYTADDGYKSLNYSNLTAVLVEAIKALQKRVEELEK